MKQKDDDKTIELFRGPLMREKLLTVLREDWTTPVDALKKAQCFSLSQRVGDFKRDGIPVEDKWVNLPSGKRVKAYRIAA